MKPDSLAFLSVHLPAGALPWQILAILLIGFFVVLGMLIQKAGEFKNYASGDFPTHSATVLVGLGAFAMTIPILLSRIALGMEAPGGTGDLLAAEIGLAGVTAAMLGVKRFSSPEYLAGKATVEAAKSASPQVTVTGNANVNTDAGNSAQTSTFPQAGVRPTNVDITAPLEGYAARQREIIESPSEATD